MAIDAYIKFGEGTDLGPDNKPLPKIEGDSDDEAHYWWCELRGCDFEMEAKERSEDDADTKEEKKAKAELKPITIKKRVDWASCELFTKCCEAAEATTKKADDDQEKGRIKQITVEVCRQSGEKFPFLIIKYTGVTVVKYGIDMSGPEPTETITFKADMTQFEYQRTDPETGQKKGGPARTGELASYTPTNQGNGQGGGAGVDAEAVAAAAATALAGGPDGSGSLDSLTPTEAAMNANFPGLGSSTGLGLLPD